MRDIKYIVIHCSDTPNGKHFDAIDIHNWHKERKFDGIGYHAVILIAGSIQQGRPEYWVGAHVRGHNENSLGVCLIGKTEFDKEQWCSLATLIEFWKKDRPDAIVLGHRDFPCVHKNCPGFDVKEWWEQVKIKEVSNGPESG